jgi:hypothetical protein
MSCKVTFNDYFGFSGELLLFFGQLERHPFYLFAVLCWYCVLSDNKKKRQRAIYKKIHSASPYFPFIYFFQSNMPAFLF